MADWEIRRSGRASVFRHLGSLYSRCHLTATNHRLVLDQHPPIIAGLRHTAICISEKIKWKQNRQCILPAGSNLNENNLQVNTNPLRLTCNTVLSVIGPNKQTKLKLNSLSLACSAVFLSFLPKIWSHSHVPGKFFLFYKYFTVCIYCIFCIRLPWWIDRSIGAHLVLPKRTYWIEQTKKCRSGNRKRGFLSHNSEFRLNSQFVEPIFWNTPLHRASPLPCCVEPHPHVQPRLFG